MAIAFVQKGSALNSGSGGNAVVSCAYGSSVASGHLLVAVVFGGDGSVIPAATCSDTLGNTWTAATSNQQGGVTNSTVQMFYAVAGSSGSNAVSATFSVFSSSTV